MVNEPLHRLKTGAIEETRKLFGIFIYFWVLLSLFSFHKALLLNEESLIYQQGFALINALALAKVVLIGEFFHLGDNLKNRPLIYPIVSKSAIFAVLLICFHIIEETLVGVLHGKTISQSIPDIGGGKLQGILMVGIIMFVVLMPFFAFRELDRVIGTEELHTLLFGEDTKARAAPPIMRGRGWRTAAAAALAVLAIGGGWLTWSLRRSTMAHHVAQKLEPGSEVRAVTASGIVGPAATAQVVARVSGVIQTLDCDAKMKVKAGQVCAKIDPRPYQIMLVDRNKSDLAGAEARCEKDKADLVQAKAAFEHQEALAKRRAISQKAIDNSRKAYEQAQARTKLEEATVAQLQAALHAAEIDLGSIDVVSPIDGRVLSRNVTTGETIAGGLETPPLFLIAADLTVIHVDARVSEKDIGEIKQGDKATFTVEAFPNRPFTGEVTQIRQSPQIYEHGAAYDVVISAPNPDLLLEPGMTATIRIVID
jgi:RND family efflux transporter MFP subunit